MRVYPYNFTPENRFIYIEDDYGYEMKIPLEKVEKLLEAIKKVADGEEIEENI